MPIEKIRSDRGEGVGLPPLCRNLLTLRLDRGVDPALNQFEPAPCLRAGVFKSDGTIVAERSSRRVLWSARIPRAEDKGQMPAIGDPEREPWNDRVPVIDSGTRRGRLARFDVSIGEFFSWRRLLHRPLHYGATSGQQNVAPYGVA